MWYNCRHALCGHTGSSAFFLTGCVKMVNLCPKQLRLVSGFSVFTPWAGVPRGNGAVPSQSLPLMKQKRTVFCHAETSCPAGQIYRSCSQGDDDGLHPGRGVACERTCESYLLNLTCSTHELCVAGCVCPSGWAYVKRHCVVSLDVCSHYHYLNLCFHKDYQTNFLWKKNCD